jgi:hypothetical protein
MIKNRSIITAVILSMFFWNTGAYADVPDLIPVQGVLTDGSGQVINGATDLNFSLYGSNSGGPVVWTESYNDFVVLEGFFTVYLGTNEPLDPLTLAGMEEVWLEMEVNDESLGRVRLASVPFAMEAQICRQLGGLTEDDVQPVLAGDAACNPGYYLRGWDQDAGVPLCDLDRIGDGGVAEYVAYDLNCTEGDCVSSGEVEFIWAAGATKGGNAAMADDLDCTDCVSDVEVSDDLSINNGRLFAPGGAGNVGIGRADAFYELDVDGTARFTSTIIIGSGAPYTLPTSDGSNDHALFTDGSGNVTWQLVPGDDWGEQAVETTSRLTGDGTPGSELDLAQQGAASGEALKWNGTSWAPAAESDPDVGTLVANDVPRWDGAGQELQPGTIVDTGTSVGIGIGSDTPSQTLEVGGNVHVSGSGNGIYFQDGTFQDTASSRMQNVIHVAKSGADFATIQGAVDSISDATVTNPYLVWVAPGVYNEAVTLKPFVHLQGAGREATIVTSTLDSSGWYSSSGTITLESNVSVRDLTAINTGNSQVSNVAIVGNNNLSNVLVANVTARAECTGAGKNAYGLFLRQVVSSRIENVDSSATSIGGARSYGAYLFDSNIIIRGGSYAGTDGSAGVWGIFVRSSTLEAFDTTVTVTNAQNNTVGLFYYDKSHAVLHGGSFSAQTTGTDDSTGISFGGDDTSTLLAIDVTVEVEVADSLARSRGFYQTRGDSKIRGGSFTAVGGEANGIYVHPASGANPNMTAIGVEATGDGVGIGYGFHGYGGDSIKIQGGIYKGISSTNDAYGIYKYGGYLDFDVSQATLIAVAESANTSFGFRNYGTGATQISQSTVTTSSVGNSWGISNHETMSVLNVSVVSEDRGIFCSGSTIEVMQSTVQSTQDTLKQQGECIMNAYGSVLVGGAPSGTVNCVGISDGAAFYTNTCPI